MKTSPLVKVVCTALFATVCAARLSAEEVAELEEIKLNPLSEIKFNLEIGWDSRYMSEGRDELAGDGLAATTLEASYKDLTLGLWYSASPDEDYREYQISAAYTIEWRDFEFGLSYTHLRFPSEKEHDNELAFAIVFPELPGGIVAELETVWSFEADGAFIEASVSRDCEVADWLTLTPWVGLGWNEGFVDDGHKGANHVALGIEAALPVKDDTALVFRCHYSRAIDADAERYPEDESLKNRFTWGLALQAAF